MIKKLPEINREYGLLHIGCKPFGKPINEIFDFVYEITKNIKYCAIPAWVDPVKIIEKFPNHTQEPPHHKLGMFSQESFQRGLQRTEHPFHSLFFMDNNIPPHEIHENTFNKDGIYKYFTLENSIIINIGITYIRNTVLHYIENQLHPPYLQKNDYVLNNMKVQFNTNTPSFIRWNRRKILNFLLENGCCTEYYNDGVIYRLVDGYQSNMLITKHIKNDPYFLIR